MNYKKALLTILTIIITCTVSYADNNFKLGYIDVSKIFTTSSPAIALQEAIKNKFKPREQELVALKNTLTNEEKQIEILRAHNTNYNKLSNSDKDKLEKFRKDQLDFQQKYLAMQQSLQATQDYASALLLGEANTILRNISSSGGYDLVLTSQQLVYAKPKYDLTSLVISKLQSTDSSRLVKQLLINADKDGANPHILQSLAKPKIQ